MGSMHRLVPYTIVLILCITYQNSADIEAASGCFDLEAGGIVEQRRRNRQIRHKKTDQDKIKQLDIH